MFWGGKPRSAIFTLWDHGDADPTQLASVCLETVETRDWWVVRAQEGKKGALGYLWHFLCS